MSTKVATLVVSLLALAEGQSNDRDVLREANTDEVLNVISPELIDRVAHRLYADDEANLSAYERLMANDKRKKMEYLNNIRPDLIPTPEERALHHETHSEGHHEPVRHSDDHHTIDDIPTSDPTKESIRDQVMRESARRQNNLMEAKREREEAAKAEKE